VEVTAIEKAVAVEVEGVTAGNHQICARLDFVLMR
jgi:hypothetical protein